MHYDDLQRWNARGSPWGQSPAGITHVSLNERRETSLRRTQLDLKSDVCIKPGMNVINVEKGRSFISLLPQIQVSVCQVTSTSPIDADKQHFIAFKNAREAALRNRTCKRGAIFNRYVHYFQVVFQCKNVLHWHPWPLMQCFKTFFYI